MGEEGLRIQPKVLLLSLGLSFYWLWLIAGILSTMVWYGSAPVNKGDTWIVTLLANTLVLMLSFIFSRRTTPLSSKPLVVIASGCVTSAGIALVSTAFNFAVPGDALFVGCFLTGMGAAPLGICWRECIETTGSRRMQHQVISVSMVASVLFFLVAFSLPYAASMTICALAPIGSAVLFLRAADSRKDAPAPGAKSEVRVDAETGAATAVEAGLETGARTLPPQTLDGARPENMSPLNGLRKLASLLACCFVLSFAQGVFKSGALSVDTQLTWTLVTSCAILLVLAVVAIDLALLRRREHQSSDLFMVSRLFLPVVVVACLSLPFFISPHPVLIHFFIFAGNFLLLTYLYSEIAVNRSDVLSPSQVFASGIIASNTGCMLGLLLEKTAGFESFIILYGVLYFAAGLAFVLRHELRKPKEVDEPEVPEAPPPLPAAPEDGRPQGDQQPDMLDSIAKQCRTVGERYSLSERECDILTLLVRGKSANTIATMSFISYNTVKTHITHIYRKLGVHSKEEAIKLVEDSFRLD
jgi:DNA-binding CsgD family transcriptional regulator